MNLKWIGAILVISGCSAVGFMQAAGYKREEKALQQLIGALDFMTCELQYRLTPLPDLCRQAGRERNGCVGKVLTALALELESQLQPDVQHCMTAAFMAAGEIPVRVRKALDILGSTLGRFDMEGQLKGLQAARNYCRRELELLSSGRDNRLRSFQTLGICAGAALAILFV